MICAYRHIDGSAKAAIVPTVAHLARKSFVVPDSIRELDRVPGRDEQLDSDTLEIVPKSPETTPQDAAKARLAAKWGSLTQDQKDLALLVGVEDPILLVIS